MFNIFKIEKRIAALEKKADDLEKRSRILGAEETDAEKLGKEAEKRRAVKNLKEKYIKKIMETTGWTEEETLCRYTEARKRTGCNAKEYFLYRFYEQSEEEQEKILVAALQSKLRAKYDNRKIVMIICSKARTNEYFSNLVKRPWCVNTEVSERKFARLFAGSGRIIYKPMDGNRGKGIEAFDVNADNIGSIYGKLVKYPKGVVEQYVVQHPELNRLCSASVNSVRVVTVSSDTDPVTADGKMMDIAYASLRIGGGSSVVDNFHSGGMVANIDLKTGELITDAADMEGNVFIVHPVSGVAIKGFKVPHFDKIPKMIEKTIKKKKIKGYLGWDIAIREDGPVLLEVNTMPGVVLLSTPYAAEHKGMKHVLEKYL